MSDTMTWLDGNAVAGLLTEVFEAEITGALRTCGSCGTSAAVGAHRAYFGAGTVLRCPACSDLALRVAILPDRFVVEMRGAWAVQLPRAGPESR
jgi:uncharacterized protein DUF6510